jgi:hypothetical protein
MQAKSHLKLVTPISVRLATTSGKSFTAGYDRLED